jgi:hypothetical protein
MHIAGGLIRPSRRQHTPAFVLALDAPFRRG